MKISNGNVNTNNNKSNNINNSHNDENDGKRLKSHCKHLRLDREFFTWGFRSP